MIYDLEIRNLSKSFGGFALRNVSFALPKGYIMGLIGPNGSGKTTTIQLILNMLRRDSGTIKVLGRDSAAQERAIKASLGVVFDSSCFSDDWRAAQVEQAISPFYANWNKDTFAQLLRKFHIDPTRRGRELSRGMQWLAPFPTMQSC